MLRSMTDLRQKKKMPLISIQENNINFLHGAIRCKAIEQNASACELGFDCVQVLL